MKKRIVILLICVIMVIAALIYFFRDIIVINTPGEENNRIVRDEEAQKEYAKEYFSLENIEEDEHGNTESSGGIVEGSESSIDFNNLYESLELTKAIEIEEKILSDLQSLEILKKEVMELKDEEIEGYYNKQKDQLVLLFGIDSHIEFKAFIEPIEKLETPISGIVTVVHESLNNTILQITINDKDSINYQLSILRANDILYSYWEVSN